MKQGPGVMTESDLLIKIHLNLTAANGLLSGEVLKPVVIEEDVILSHNIGFLGKNLGARSLYLSRISAFMKRVYGNNICMPGKVFVRTVTVCFKN